MEFTIQKMQAFPVIGIVRTFDYQLAYEKIPLFWREFMKKFENIFHGQTPLTPAEMALIDNKIGEFGVCINDVGPGQFRYMIAGRYQNKHLPEGFSTYVIPECEWVKFRAVGPLPAALQTLNTAIYKTWLPSNPQFQFALNLNIEWYAQADPKASDYISEVWLPIKRI